MRLEIVIRQRGFTCKSRLVKANPFFCLFVGLAQVEAVGLEIGIARLDLGDKELEKFFDLRD